METIQSVQTSFKTSASGIRDALSEKKNDVQRIAEENVELYLKQASDLKNNVIEKTAEYQKIAGDTVGPYIGQAVELKKTVTGTAEHYKELATATVTDQAGNLKASSADVVSRMSTLTERVVPMTGLAKEHVTAAIDTTTVFIDERAKEDLKENTDYTLTQYYVAAFRSSIRWSHGKVAQAYNQCLEKIEALRPEVLSEKFVDGSMFFYMQWTKTTVLALCNTILSRLPIDEKAFTEKLNELSQFAREKGNYVVEQIRCKAEEPLNNVIDKCEPLRDVLSTKSAQVEGLVKHQNINELVGISVTSAKEFLYGNRVEGTSEVSDTTVASPIDD